VVAVLKGSFNIWLGKCWYTNPVTRKPINTLTWVMNTEDYLDPLIRDDFVTRYHKLNSFKK
jgi:hypothetical protein